MQMFKKLFQNVRNWGFADAIFSFCVIITDIKDGAKMTDNENEIFENVLSRFKVVRRWSDKALCVCPCHADKQASLSVAKGRKGVLVNCFAGCKYTDVIEAVGLLPKDLFYPSDDNSKNWVKFIENREGKKIEKVYDYVDFEGNYAFSKVRLIPKSFIFGRFEGDLFHYGLGKPRKEIRAIYGDLKAMQGAIEKDNLIILTEGEKDISNLKLRGYSAAFCVGSCKDWLPDYVELVKGANLVVIADYDDPGFDFAKKVISDCLPVAKSVRVCYFPLFKGADLSDWLDSGGTLKGLLDKIKNAPPLESGVI